MAGVGSSPTGVPPVMAAGALDASLAGFAGVGPKRLAALSARGLHTFRDALLHLPYRYDDLRRRDRIGDLRPGMTAIVEGRLHDLKTRPMRGMGWRRMTTATLKDERRAGLRVVWFNLHGDGRMPLGERLLLYGRVTAGASGAVEMLHPEIYRLASGAPPGIRAVYSLPPAVAPRLFSGIVAEAVARARTIEIDPIPAELRTGLELSDFGPDFATALAWLHQPSSDAELEMLEAHSTPDHQALALSEMFAFQLALAQERARGQRRSGAALNPPGRLVTAFLESLPYAPTAAQGRAIAAIATDLAAPTQMNRILIGDVGSGKTLVAFAAILRAVESGWQTVMMAPTELLAEQHSRNFSRTCAALGVTSALITARLTAGERARTLRALGRGEIAVAFGTQALIQEAVKIRRLGLAIIDEQHRFGVFDRARLIALGSQANVLSMTATPIPRSLALSLLRNLDVTVLDEMPPGRKPVATRLFEEGEVDQIDTLLRAQVELGYRAYYVAPLIEGEDDDAATVAAVAQRLAAALRQFRIGTLHGRMPAAAKESVMRDFRDGALDVLVATTVIEVGVDVPEATIIVINSAERYGLAQLHQLRGRVGRGAAAGQCCLVISRDAAASARTRLTELARTSSGHEVAELDLRARGPGDLFGVRQTGALPLRFAGFIRNLSLIERAGELAEEWLNRDPSLASPASAAAVRAIGELRSLGFSLGDVG